MPMPRNDDEQSYRDAMRDLIAHRFGSVWKAAPVAIAGEDPAGVHDVRVASRRLRAAMDIADGCFPSAWFEPLHRTAKQITSALGEVRDRDVLLEFLVAERAAAPESDWPGIDRLVRRVEAERNSAREAMIIFLNSIEELGAPAAAARRFGAAAAAPKSSEKDS